MERKATKLSKLNSKILQWLMEMSPKEVKARQRPRLRLLPKARSD